MDYNELPSGAYYDNCKLSQESKVAKQENNMKKMRKFTEDLLKAKVGRSYLEN